MSRGTSRPKIIDAVLLGLQATDGQAAPYAVAEALLRNAQPCRVDVGMDLAGSAAPRRAPIGYEVRVLGLTGGIRATVALAADAKPASVAAGLTDLKGALRRRGEPGVCRMLALRLEGKTNEAGIEQLREAVASELGARADAASIVTGEAFEMAGKSVVPAVVVVS